MVKRKPAGGRNAEEPVSVLKPVILVPTPAQLAAGQRVIDADPAVWCKSVTAMVNRAERNGWNWRVSYSHFLDAPPNTGRWAGQWVPKHSLAVRMSRDGIQCHGIWYCAEGESWRAGGAQALSSSCGLVKPFGIEALEKLIDGKMTIMSWRGMGLLVPREGLGS